MISITDNAANQIETLIVSNSEKKGIDPKTLFLRVYIAGAGPQGLNHGLALTTEKREDDLILEKDNIVVLVDRMSEQYLNGAEIDFVTHEFGSNFKINNPNQVQAAGCSSCSGDSGCC
jgi:iron-sulfur cluster assembly accessory protein